MQNALDNAANKFVDLNHSLQTHINPYLPTKSDVLSMSAAGAGLGTLFPGSSGGRVRGGLIGAGRGLGFAGGYSAGSNLAGRYLTNEFGLSESGARLLGGLAGGTVSSLLAGSIMKNILGKPKPVRRPSPYMLPPQYRY